MTREEAEIYARNISYEDALFNLTKARAIPYKKATLIKVYELIQALSQEPCDDAISREAAIIIAGTHTLTVDETIKALEQLPSVTPTCEEREKGECPYYAG